MDSETPPKAVFLSYAREDGEAAQRIADAMRAFGIVVWFDRNELRGGDSWDAKIRRQIRECALFVPIISVHTQARGEGYFRREWKAGVERTHDMASSLAFIVPVAIDETGELDALVPEEFMKVQWTRLERGVPTPDFINHVKRLIEAPLPAKAGRGRPASRTLATGSSLAAAPAIPGWIWGGLIGLVALGLAVLLYVRRAEPAAATASAPAPTPVPTAAAPSPAPAVDGKSIAVLPFENFSEDKENEFFASGLHDEVITALAKVHDLKVISRTSVMAYKNPDGRNLRKIGSELGVATVLEGSVQRAGNRVHLNVQLIDTRTDAHLWAESYTNDLSDVFSLEASLAQQIAEALKANFTESERSLIARRPTQNQAAFDLYLKARLAAGLISRADPVGSFEKVIGMFEQVEALDPGFADPHVQAALLHGQMYWFAALDSTDARKERMRSEVEAAERIAPDSPEAHMARGYFEYTGNNDWEAALREYLVTERSLPNDDQIQFRIGITFRRLGRFQEAYDRLLRAAELNPHDQFNVTTAIETAFFMHRFPTAIELTEHYRRINPAMSEFGPYLARSKLEVDGDQKAYVKAIGSLTPQGGFLVGEQARDYQAAVNSGDLEGAARALEDGKFDGIQNAGGSIKDPIELFRAMIAMLLGRKDQARQFGTQAIAIYKGRTWNARQKAWALMGIARAEMYAGQVDDSLRDAREALALQRLHDAFDYDLMYDEYGRLLILAGKTDDALGVLKDLTRLPGTTTPNFVRISPVWSKLKGNPRFEEILSESRPL